jgi:hypothetical protein
MEVSHKEKLLFTKDDWSIYSAEYKYAGVRGHVTAYAHHHECAISGGYSGAVGSPTNCWHTGDLIQKCILCNAKVPDGIQALVVLYQWEK